MPRVAVHSFTMADPRMPYRCGECSASWSLSVAKTTAVQTSGRKFRTIKPDEDGWFHCCSARFRWEDAWKP